ncbi:MAG: transposase [Rudanella sp.]|nr:transposase [Rudanella sp.]
MDATEWSIGKFKLHCLVLAVDYQCVAIPVYFKLYQHKGVLSQQERIAFMESANRFCQLTDSVIIADREFIGDDWFVHFYTASLDFIVRLRKGQYKHQLVGNRHYETLEKRARKKGKASALIVIDGFRFRLWIVKNANRTDKEPLIYILTTILGKRDTPDLYRLRWKIETLFKHLKTNGYNLEDLRLTELSKIRLLVSLVVLAYIIAILMALDARKTRPVSKNYYKDGTSFDRISMFKEGQSLLKQSFITVWQLLEIIQYINIKASVPIPNWRLNVQ